MLVLHHPDTLLHKTIEILNGKSIDAYESPDRLHVILKALASVKDKDGTGSLHQVVTMAHSMRAEDVLTTNVLLEESHDKGYLEYLKTIHSRWVAQGVIEQNESLLPEAFFVAKMAKMVGHDIAPPVDILARPGFYSFDLSTGIMEHTWKSVFASARLVVEATQRVIFSGLDGVKEPVNSILALTRPPGHHCTTDMAGGYCYVNNAVLAVHALRHWDGVKMAQAPAKECLPNAIQKEDVVVAIVDIDFHHGNGTQQAFYGDWTVPYFSIHGKDEYPYFTGTTAETGSGAGSGFTRNEPLPPRASVADYLGRLKGGLEWVSGFKPHYVVVSLGFDTHRMDPLGAFDIDTEDYKTIARDIRQGTKGLPAVILLEGGYYIESLGECMVQFLEGWEEGELKTPA